MKFLLSSILFLVSYLSFSQDSKYCPNIEPSYLNRLPGFSISDCENSEFNSVNFTYYVKGEPIKITKEGRYRKIFYSLTDNTRKYSGAQMVQNYSNAVLKIGGTVLADNKSFMKASIDNMEVYIQLPQINSSELGSYWVIVLEVATMKQEIEITLQESIDKNGKVELYGILFDTGKSEIKPESAGTLQKIADYLNENPTVKVVVVGHTDNVGKYADNIILSKSRAENIKNYLVNNLKINSTRLLSEGVGQCCPITSNSTEEGRKLNRRVEITKL